MTFRLSENCSICSSPRWCGRPCVHAPERERQIEHMVDPPVILTKEMAAEGEAARDEAMEALAAGKPYVPTKRGRPPKRTPEERKAYRAELMRKKRAEGK